MNNVEQILMISIIIVAIIITVLLVVLFALYLSSKAKENNKQSEAIKGNGKSKTNNSSKTISDKKSIFDFLEFDDVQDNMIIQDDGNKFLMVVECQGINYDLMSEVEKTAVEDGFVQFLNTLRYKIQIYIQTRKVDLEKSIQAYEKSIRNLEADLRKSEMQYREMKNSEIYNSKDVEAQFYELTKKRNLYEYGQDVVRNTKTMSLNKSILTKKYYIIIPYLTAEMEKNDFDKKEIQNMAFSELYTRAQSIIRTLFACEVKAHVLNTREIIDLLYVAYNRDDAEVYGVDKYINAGYESLYSTAPDVLDKRIKALNEEIKSEAEQLVNEKVSEVELKKREKINNIIENKEETIKDLALIILNENKKILGNEVSQEVENKIKNEGKGGKKNVGAKKKK